MVNRAIKQLLSPLLKQARREQGKDTDKSDDDPSADGPQSLLKAINEGRRERTHEIISRKPEWVSSLCNL